ncbi:HutD family protein [Lysobacter sp. H21R4]|uniref:HutD/Ves family protein n=1 Tax=Lysobacter sp. H21R4 TaxID=2781021 RepID=UPI0018886E01|nr:HutD family protein [Lysobacter sp. H21R4]QOY63977.1 HutD family protein [Lysobacter sp. H21R4]
MAVTEMKSHVIHGADYRRERWRNGLGWTREVSRSGDESDFTWRISIAEIDADAAFSCFPGIDREISLLSGNGVELCFEDGSREALEPPHGRYRFEGERTLHAELRDGPVQVCNLMWSRERTCVESWCRPLVGSMVLFAAAGETWLLHLIAGQASFAESSGLPALSAGDTAVLHSSAGGLRQSRDACEVPAIPASASGERFVMDGDGYVLVARITAANSAGRGDQ